jgi:hypothetical protein
LKEQEWDWFTLADMDLSKEKDGALPVPWNSNFNSKPWT